MPFIILGLLLIVMVVIVGALMIYFVIGLGILTLIQFLLFKLIKLVTGKEIPVQVNTAGFVVETVILIGIFAAYASLPARPITLKAEECAAVYYQYNELDYETSELCFTHQASIQELLDALSSLEVSHTLPTTIKYSYPNAETGYKFKYYYFYDENGDFLQAICVYDDLIGVSHKLDGKFTYYNTKETVDWYSLLRGANETENKLSVEERCGEAMQTMMDSFEYEAGTYTFTVPEFDADYVNIKIYGSQEVYTSTVVRSTGYELIHNVKNDTIYYLTEHTEAADWQAGRQYSFTLDETTFRGLTCAITIDKSTFRYSIPLTDAAYIADREHPTVYYVDP